MSRRDYVRVADVLAGEYALALHDQNDDKLDTVRNITMSLADVFKQDNIAFSRERFYAAVMGKGSHV